VASIRATANGLSQINGLSTTASNLLGKGTIQSTENNTSTVDATIFSIGSLASLISDNSGVAASIYATAVANATIDGTSFFGVGFKYGMVEISGQAGILARLVDFLQDKAIANPPGFVETSDFLDHPPPLSYFLKKIPPPPPVPPESPQPTPIYPIVSTMMPIDHASAPTSYQLTEVIAEPAPPDPGPQPTPIDSITSTMVPVDHVSPPTSFLLTKTDTKLH